MLSNDLPVFLHDLKHPSREGGMEYEKAGTENWRSLQAAWTRNWVTEDSSFKQLQATFYKQLRFRTSIEKKPVKATRNGLSVEQKCALFKTHKT